MLRPRRMKAPVTPPQSPAPRNPHTIVAWIRDGISIERREPDRSRARDGGWLGASLHLSGFILQAQLENQNVPEAGPTDWVEGGRGSDRIPIIGIRASFQGCKEEKGRPR